MNYQDQLQRARRFLHRVENSRVNQILELPPEKQTEYEDMLYAFFQNCWHIKDWIKNDASSPRLLAESVSDTRTLPRSLLLCADIANASKHLRRNTRPHVGGNIRPEIKVELTESFVTGESSGRVLYEYRVEDNAGSSEDALAVARQAMQDWEALITGNGGRI
jgi:hypothetical protein